MSINHRRRQVMGGMTAAFASTMLRSELASAQTPSGVLRVGMTVAAVPNSNGAPDQGGEGQRFMGVTLYDQLVAFDLSRSDQPAALRPCLATAWAADPNNPKRWIFKLREGVKFHDGREFVGADAVFSFDRAFKKDSPVFDQRAFSQVLPQVPNIASWGSDGKYNFWIETTVVDGTLPYSLTWMNMVSEAGWLAANKDWNAYMSKAVGTGPWKLQSINQSERCVMVRNADYWDSARVPKCAQLILLPIPDPNTRVAALQSGQVDFIEAPSPDAAQMLKSNGFQIVTNIYPHNWMWFLSQTPDSPWRDERLRKALNVGIDRSGLKQLLGDLMVEGQGVVPKGHPWYGNPTFTLDHNPELAKKLLSDAGYSTSKPLRTKVAISSSGSGQMQPIPMNEFIQQNLREVGIEIEYEVFEWQALIEAWKSGAGSPVGRGCTALNISQAPSDPFRVFPRILQTDMAAPKGVNWSKFSDPEMDKKFAAVLREMDGKKQDAMLADLHTEVVDRCLFLFAAHDLNPRALAPSVKGFVQAQSWFQDLTPIQMSS